MKSLVPALLLALSASLPAYALDISACPAVVPPGEVGVVQGDLACSDGSSANAGFSIVLQKGARLDLNGHTITYQQLITQGLVYCESKCEIVGGVLQAGPVAGSGVWVKEKGRASIEDVVISGFHLGIVAPNATVLATNVSITADHAGIVVAKRVELDHVDVTLPGGVGPCIEAANAGKVFGNDVTVSGCDYGVYGNRRVDVANLTVTDSRIGVFSGGRVLLTDSSVTGSEHYDIYSGLRPKLVNTTCDVSQKYNRLLFQADGTWNACPGE